MKNSHRLSPAYSLTVGLDLGAKNNGVFLISNFSTPTQSSSQSAFLVVNEGNVQYSMKARTAARHRMRGKKRFALARRLLILITEQVLQKHSVKITAKEKHVLIEALCGLIRRRGYSRAETETDLTVLEGLNTDVFLNAPGFSEFLTNDRIISTKGIQSIAEAWEELSQDMNIVQDFLNVHKEKSAKEFEQYIKAEYPDCSQKDELKKYLVGYRRILEDANNIVNLKSLGHLHRIEYFKDIQAVISKDSRLKPLVKALGSEEKLFRLVGNVSNLQLRAERWYFNAPFLIGESAWNPERLKESLIRAFKYFVPEGTARQDLSQLIVTLKQAPDVIEFLCSVDPVRTIPPYENQNNRRPPVDLTLLLSPEQLNKRYSNRWKIWAQQFLLEDASLKEKLDEILDYTDRKSRIKINGHEPCSLEEYRLSYILQRVVDRTKVQDKYSVRKLAALDNPAQENESWGELGRVIGNHHREEFISFARDYYEEIALSKTGLWSTLQHHVTERSDIHPPMKNKVLDILVGNVLQISPTDAKKFIETVWKSKFHGNSSVASFCKSLEEKRKSYGGGFNLELKYACKKAEKNEKLNPEEKNLAELPAKIDQAARFIGENLGISAQNVEKFNNPFSLSQLYTLIETERNGFTSTCMAVHLENAWRMTTTTNADGEITAQCSRLSSDVIRPFDGVVRRVLDKNAWEVAQRMVEKIKADASEIRGKPLNISVVLESNKFAFTASLWDLKKDLSIQISKEKEGKLNRSIEKQSKRWADKDERIKSAARNVCAYTGKLIVDSGEIDHIIPRSLTNKIHETVFNAEANLIFVSREGNSRKNDKFYTLNTLASNYLKAVFNTTDHSAIVKRIEETVKQLDAQKRLGFFELLTEEEQDCVRHALFLDSDSEAREIVLNALGNRRKTLVNGTQAWFARALITKVEKELSDWVRETKNQMNYRVFAVNAEEVSRVRRYLGKNFDVYRKETVQSAASHCLDALCTYAVACEDPKLNSFILGNPKLSEEKNVCELAETFPAEVEIVRVMRRPPALRTEWGSVSVFKEGIYGEKFLPIIVEKGRVFIGFDSKAPGENSKNVVEVVGKTPEAFLDLMTSFLDKPIEDLQKKSVYRIQSQKAFEFLSKVAHESCSEQELLVANLLESLIYSTVKKDVASTLSPDGKKLISQEDWSKKSKNFEIKVQVSLGKGKNKISANGKVVLPAKAEWQQILDHDSIKPNLGSKLEFNLHKVIRDLWKLPSHPKPHHPTRRVFSLPMIDNPSGGVRIRRKNYKNEILYQTHAANQIYEGFEKNQEIVNWKSPVLDKSLRKPSLTVKEGRYFEPSEVCFMTDWRIVRKGSTKFFNSIYLSEFNAQASSQEQLEEECDLELSMAPDTSDRRSIRLRIPFKVFFAWLRREGNDEIKSDALRLRGSIKLKNSEDINNFVGRLDESMKNILGKPRSALFIEEVGAYIQFRYKVESSSSSMNEAFNHPVL